MDPARSRGQVWFGCGLASIQKPLKIRQRSPMRLPGPGLPRRTCQAWVPLYKFSLSPLSAARSLLLVPKHQVQHAQKTVMLVSQGSPSHSQTTPQAPLLTLTAALRMPVGCPRDQDTQLSFPLSARLRSPGDLVMGGLGRQQGCMPWDLTPPPPGLPPHTHTCPLSRTG